MCLGTTSSTYLHNWHKERVPLCQRPKVNKVPGSQISCSYYHHQHPFNFCGRNSICNQMHCCVWQSMVTCNCRNKTNVNPIGILSFDSFNCSAFYILDSSEFSSQYSSFPYHEVSQEKRGYNWILKSRLAVFELLTIKGRVVLGKELGRARAVWRYWDFCEVGSASG